MAGIYIHVPFCKTRCIYCDFYSSNRWKRKPLYIDSLCKELEMRKDYLQGEPVNTIYFGGGTPTQLEGSDFKKIFATIDHIYGLENTKEITLEANPDDLSPEYLDELRRLPFNRLSLGIQTFDDTMLSFLGRRHNAQQAIRAVKDARAAGFDNISIDLMYGLPGETRKGWEKDIEKALSLDVEHISAYHLIYEEWTPIYKMLRDHQVEEATEENSLLFFSTLIDRLRQGGYEHYEISNFCKPDKESLHNTSYWKGIKYMGCGPAAHSYNGSEREWNITSISRYNAGISLGERIYETEILDQRTQYNDLVITSIRTKWGLSLQRLQQEFGQEYTDYCMKMAQKHIQHGELEERDGVLKLTEKGIFISDGIMSDLLRIDD